MVKEYYIGDFLKRIKRPVDLDDDVEYQLVTVKLNHNGVTQRTLKKGCEIKSKMYEVKTGDFILSGIDARNGAFGIIPSHLDGAIVTNDFWYFDIDERIINKQLFLELTATSWFDHICKRGSDGTTQRIRLQKDKFFNQKIILPNPTEQADLLIKIQGVRKNLSEINKQTEIQQQTITQLKQSILQDAISGKLTEQWRKENPDVEPASKLLKRIKAEKEKLVKEKKIKKEKPLPPVTKEEIPFELPDGWVWCRLGEIIIFTENLNIQSKLKSDELINYVDIDSIDNKNYIISEIKIKPVSQLSSRARRVLKKGVIIYSLVRPYLNNIAIVNEEKKNFIGSTGFAVFTGIYVISEFVKTVLLSKYIEMLYLEWLSGFNSPTVSQSEFRNTPFPLPPLMEQESVVKKVEESINACHKIDNQINQSQKDAGLLMQVVLKEAFEEAKV